MSILATFEWLSFAWQFAPFSSGAFEILAQTFHKLM